MPDRARASVPEIGRVERAVAMRNFPGAAELHASELAVLASVARPRRFGPGEVLAREGVALPAIALVLEGEVTVRSEGELIEQAGPGSTLGALAALARDPRGLECKTDKGASVLSISLEDLEDVFEEVPSFLVRLMAHVAHRALERKLLRPGAPPRLRAGPATLPDRQLDLVERILHLRACATFASVTIDAIAALADVAREIRVASGEALWRKGDAASCLFLIVAGELDVVLDAQVRTTLRAGDLAGDVEVLAGVPRPTDATASGTLVALAIDREALFDTWEDHIDIGVELLRDVSTTAITSARAGGAGCSGEAS